MNSALQKSIEITADKSKTTRETEDLLKETNTSELILALCGPIGSPLKICKKYIGKFFKK